MAVGFSLSPGFGSQSFVSCVVARLTPNLLGAVADCFPFSSSLIPLLAVASGMTADILVPLTSWCRQKMHFDCSTHPAWKHLHCGYCRLVATEPRDARSSLFQPASDLLEPSSLNTGSKVQPTSRVDG